MEIVHLSEDEELELDLRIILCMLTPEGAREILPRRKGNISFTIVEKECKRAAFSVRENSDFYIKSGMIDIHNAL